MFIDFNKAFNLVNQGFSLLGSTAKKIAASCQISPYVTLKIEVDVALFFFRFQNFTFNFDHSDSFVLLSTALE